MKTMTCKQLGGACDLEFHANTFEEMAEQSKQHGMAMYKQQEPAHLEAMQKMQAMMQSPGEVEKWQEGKKKEFDALPDNS